MTTASVASVSANSRQHASNPVAQAQDIALLRLVDEKDPYGAAHGTKGAVWEAISHQLEATKGNNKMNGLLCRARMQVLLERYDSFRAGRKISATIRDLSGVADALPIMEKALLQIAKNRLDKVQKGQEPRTTPLREKRGSPPSATVTPTSSRTKNQARTAEPVTAVLEQSKTTSSNGTAAAAAVVETSSDPPPLATGKHKVKVIAKRRKRHGVKTLDEKKATTAMFEAMRVSREEYLDQLRQQAAAAEEQVATTTGTQQPRATTTSAGTLPPPAISARGATSEMDLHFLRAVIKFAPYDPPTAAQRFNRWKLIEQALTKERKATIVATVVRDRCDLLLTEYESNVGKATQRTTAAFSVDKERLRLLGMAHKKYKEYVERTKTRGTAPVAVTPVAVAVAVAAGAEPIEIENDEYEGDSQEDLLHESPRREYEVEVQETVTAPAEPRVVDSIMSTIPSPPRMSSRNKRRRRESVLSVDADPAAAEECAKNPSPSQDLDASFDFEEGERPMQRCRHQHHHHAESSGHHTETEKARAEGRFTESHSILALMQQQLSDHRHEWEREHVRRTREQDDRKHEMTALLGILSKEREDRKSEVMTMVSTINKERDDRRNEFMVMMTLVTKMMDAKAPPPPPHHHQPSSSR